VCRYLAYLGSPLCLEELIYKPTNSLVHQASDAMETPTRINADGFGVGWYNPSVHPEPVVFKEVTPAWNNANLGSLAGKIASPCILAHVRAAQRYDPVTRDNCHPFQHHRLLWMHNGDIPGRGRLHRRVIRIADDNLVARIRGSTDTELAFTLFLSFLDPPLDREFSTDELTRALERTVHRLVDWHEEDGDARPLVLNICVTDGGSLVASRFSRFIDETPSLHYGTGARYVCVEGECHMEPIKGEPGCVILASECLSGRGRWRTVEPGSLVVVRQDLTVEELPLGLE
jgi:predicted glutamine amidotransferase